MSVCLTICPIVFMSIHASVHPSICLWLHHHHQVLSALSRLNVMDLHFSLFSAFLIHSL